MVADLGSCEGEVIEWVRSEVVWGGRGTRVVGVLGMVGVLGARNHLV